MAFLPPDHQRTSRFWLSFPHDTTPDQVRRMIDRDLGHVGDFQSKLIEDALVWIGSQAQSQPDSNLARFEAWELARDVVGLVLEIGDPDFYADPPLLRSQLDERDCVAVMRDWIEFRPEWHEAMERYCAARRQEALSTLAHQSRSAKTIEAERRAM